MDDKTVIMAQTTRVMRKQRKETHSAASIDLAKKYKLGYQCFYWLSAVAALNSVIILFNSEFNVFIDFGYTAVTGTIASSLVNDIASKFPAIGGLLTILTELFINIVVGLTFFIIGYLINKKKSVAYYVGIITYLLDSLILIYTQEFTSLAVHAIIIYLLYRGFQAHEELLKQSSLASEAVKGRISRIKEQQKDC